MNDHGDLRIMRIKSEDAHRGRPERKMLARQHGNPDPPRGEHTAELSVREERDGSVIGAETRDQSVGALGYLRRRFALGTAVMENIPGWSFAMNILGATSLVRGACKTRL